MRTIHLSSFTRKDQICNLEIFPHCSKRLCQRSSPSTYEISWTHTRTFREWMDASARAETRVQNHFMSDQKMRRWGFCAFLSSAAPIVPENKESLGPIQWKTDLDKHSENHVLNHRCLTAGKIAGMDFLWLLFPFFCYIRMYCVCKVLFFLPAPV